MQANLSRAQVDHNINNVWSLTDYIAYLNRDTDCPLMSDPAHWAEMNITTAPELADYLDAACERNVEKSALSGYG